jgi:hypothetical protein
MKNDYIINKSLKLCIAIILIFSIIFVNEIDLFKSKIIYYFMFLIFISNLILLNNNPGIIILYSTLFIYVWYIHNIQ